jgi:prevent-host-death family protein
MCYIHYMKSITQRELRNDSGTILREVQSGETVIVTRNGTPVAELRPIQPHRFVPRAAIASASERAPKIDAKRFRTDIDAIVDQRIDG